jgi:hypothetical protein
MSTKAQFNKDFIGECIKGAIERLKGFHSFKNDKFCYQDTVLDGPGSVKVADEIIQNSIPSCDIFISDLTAVNKFYPRSLATIPECEECIRERELNRRLIPNPNVLIEYGVALNTVKNSRIVSVLNSEYGSPKQDKNKLPFDIAHLGFPLEYKYSDTTNDIDKVKEGFIDILVKKLSRTIERAKSDRESMHTPFSSITELREMNSFKGPFYEYSRSKDILYFIENNISKKKHFRISGPLDVGKARILFEFFNKMDNVEDEMIFLEYDADKRLLIKLCVNKIAKSGQRMNVVLTNSPSKFTLELIKSIEEYSHNIVLISTCNQEELTDELSGVEDVVISKRDIISMGQSIEDEYVKFLAPDEIMTINKISNGNISIAKLLYEYKREHQSISIKGENLDEILNLILAEHKLDKDSLTVLRTCSIFSSLGFENEVSSQYDFIISNKILFTGTLDNEKDIKYYRHICEGLIVKGLLERKGRYLSVQPLSIAMLLFKGWLSSISPSDFIQLFKDIEAYENENKNKKMLFVALNNQLKYFGNEDTTGSIVNSIVCEDSIFDDVEVLNTNLGAELILSFAEVNPQAVSDNLVRNFLNKSKEELLLITKGRRNLVWALEKLCFDRRTFADSVKVLYLFADAENESFGNNATYQFIHLFNIHLAGTEVDLKERAKVIDWVLQNKQDYSLILRAMSVGLKSGSFGRVLGSENQGLVKLKDFKPEFKEIREYWIDILAKLEDIITKRSDYFEEVCKILAVSIRDMLIVGCLNIIYPILEKVIIIRNNDWTEALHTLKIIKNHDTIIDSNNKIDELIASLTKENFIFRYKEFAVNGYIDGEYSREKINSRTEELADAFISGDENKEDCINIFYTIHLDTGYVFGRKVYENINDNDEKINAFLSVSIKVLKDIDRKHRNVIVLLGFLSNLKTDLKSWFYKELFKNDELNYLLFYFIGEGSKGEKYLDLLFDLVNSQKIELSEFLNYRYNDALEGLDDSQLNDFKNKLYNHGDEGYGVVFNLIEKYAYYNENRLELLYSILKECIYECGVKIKMQSRVDSYRWEYVICNILKNQREDDFALYLNQSIISLLSFGDSFGDRGEHESIYKILFERYFSVIWKDISVAILSDKEDYRIFYELKNIIGSNYGYNGQKVGMLFNGDIEDIFRWCKDNSPLAPVRLAEMVPIYGVENEMIHPIAKRLIDEFGDIEKVMDGISVNMGCYFWVGSVIDFLEPKKELLVTLIGHEKAYVSEWAERQVSYTEQEIMREKLSEAEENIR